MSCPFKPSSPSPPDGNNKIHFRDGMDQRWFQHSPASFAYSSSSSSEASIPYMEAQQSLLLPEDCLLMVFAFLDWKDWVRSLRASCKSFESEDFFSQFVRPITICPSKRAPTLTDGLVQASWTRHLLLKPGVYREALRITKDILVEGMGGKGAVVVECQGWNYAIAFAGLGATGKYVNQENLSGDLRDTGEKAVVRNITFVAVNPEQTFVAFITKGSQLIEDCILRGALGVAGSRTSPIIRNCSISHSRSWGICVTESASPSFEDCTVLSNERGGLWMERFASPVVRRCFMQGNAFYGMGMTDDCAPFLSHNTLERNGRPGIVRVTPNYEQVDNPFAFDSDDGDEDWEDTARGQYGDDVLL